MSSFGDLDPSGYREEWLMMRMVDIHHEPPRLTGPAISCRVPVQSGGCGGFSTHAMTPYPPKMNGLRAASSDQRRDGAR